MKDPKRLHVYGQTYNHDYAFIVGNRLALEALREAVQAALEAPGLGGTTVCAADGEGFELKVFCEDEDEYWHKSKLPYTDNDIFIKAEGDIGPWDLFEKHKKLK